MNDREVTRWQHNRIYPRPAHAHNYVNVNINCQYINEEKTLNKYSTMHIVGIIMSNGIWEGKQGGLTHILISSHRKGKTFISIWGTLRI